MSININVIRNIIRGIGSTLIIYPPHRNYLVNRSDFEALRQDWIKIGEDLSTVINKVEHEQTKK